MKNQKLISICLLVLILLEMSTKTNAQFEAAQIAPKSISPIYDVENTGNDIALFKPSTTNINFRVMVYDGSEPALSWDVDVVGGNGTLFLSNSAAYDPDVCLLNKGANVFAVVVYGVKNNNGVYLETFKWSNATTAFVSLGLTTLSTNQLRTACNIDGDRYDHFSACWDEVGNDYIHACVGKSAAANIVITCSNVKLNDVPQPLPTPPTVIVQFPYSKPDVSVISFSANDADAVFLYSFKTAANMIYVQEYRGVSAICSPPLNFLDGLQIDGDYNTMPTNTYDWPRIASQKSTNILVNGIPYFQTGYTVVYERHNTLNGANDICGRTNFCKPDPNIPGNVICTTSGVNVYTDGVTTLFQGSSTNYLPKINKHSLTRPVAAYDSRTGTFNNSVTTHGNSAVIGFNYNELLGSQKPLAFYANVQTGQPQTFNGNSFFNNTNYQDVPINQYSQDILSVSGDLSLTNDLMLYTWFDSDQQAIQYKTVDNVSHLRQSNGLDALGLIIAPNPFVQTISLHTNNESTIYQLQLSNVYGKVLLNTSGTVAQLNEQLNSTFTNAASSVYLLSITDNIHTVLPIKLIKVN